MQFLAIEMVGLWQPSANQLVLGQMILASFCDLVTYCGKSGIDPRYAAKRFKIGSSSGVYTSEAAHENEPRLAAPSCHGMANHKHPI